MEKKLLTGLLTRGVFKKWERIMRITVFLILGFWMTVSAESFSQGTKLDIRFSNRTFRDVIEFIEKNTEYVFLFKDLDLNLDKKVDIELKNATISEILDVALRGENLVYDIYERQILLRKASTIPVTQQQDKKTLTGVVLAKDGQPLTGVTVLLKGTTTGTITDANGNFTLQVPVNAQNLQFSFIGMKSIEVPIAGKKTFNIVMEEESYGIDEVVAVGYGTIRKSDLTGSVSKVNIANSSERAATSLEQLLQGQVSGVQITSNTGAPGSGMTFSIRGASSISGSNQPLIVIDGYPINSENSGVKISSGSQSGYLGNMPEENALANLNPGDIESVEILKDASATAIYGSRGTNGVVLITTKRGKVGSNAINYSFRYGISDLPKKIDVLNTADYIKYSNEAYLNSGQDSTYKQAAIDAYMKTNTNWQDLVYRTAQTQNHQLTFSGGEERMKYSIVLGYLGQEGIIKNSKFDRGSIRVNLDREFNKKFNIGLNMNCIWSNNKAAMQSSNTLEASMSVVRGALTSRPFDSPYTSEDLIDQSQTGNPLTLVELADDQNRVGTIVANMFVEYTLLKGLIFKVNGGVNSMYSHRDYYNPRGTALGNLEGGYAYRGHGESFNYLTEYTLNFNRTFNKKHRINAVGGYTWQQWTSRSFGINVLNFPNDNLLYYDLSSGTSITNPTSSTTRWALSSLITRANYSFDNRYLITFTGRADGSTRLADNNKWAFFPSLAFGWNLHNESFMKNLEFLSECKLRASYGLSGNQAIAVGATKSKLGSTGSVENESIQVGYIQSNMANPQLHWETTKQADLGIETAFFRNRLTFGFEYYKKRTKDLLIALTIPPSNGFPSYNTNQGSVENKGYEFDLRGRALTGKFKWDIAANLSINRNKIIDLGGVESFVGSTYTAVGGQTLHIAKVGYPIGSFYGYRITGIYQNAAEVSAGPKDASSTNAPGSFKFKDISGPQGVTDGVIDSYDREIIGNPFPDFVFGITNNFEWKGLTLSFLIQGSVGQDVINANRYYLDALCRGSSSNVGQKAWDNRWTGEGTSNKYPKATTSASPFSSRFTDFIVEDASFIRLKNIILSYDVPKLKSLKLKYLQLFVSAENLITITNYSGYDPEINSAGDKSMMPAIDHGSIPQYRTISMGVNVGF